MQFAAQPFGAFAHAEQAEMPANFRERFVLLEALAVVGYAQAQLSRRHLQMNADLARVRMFHRVGDGFLRDAQQMLLGLFGKRAVFAFHIYLNLHRRTRGPLVRRFRKGGRQVLTFQRRGAQIHHRTAGFGQTVPRHFARQFQMFSRQLHVSVKRESHGVQLR